MTKPRTAPKPACGTPVERPVRPLTPAETWEPKHLLQRIGKARRFPDNTCPASRHVELMARGLLRKQGYPMLQDDPEHCASSMLAAVANLYDARAELAKMKRLARAALPANWADDYDTAALAVAIGIEA